MVNPQKRSRVVIPVDDRISNLPDSLICHILSFLPTKLVVATSVLSRRWKFLWAEVTTLDFDDDKKTFDHRGNNGVDVERMNFVQFVNRVLLHNSAERLKMFRLKWRKGCEAISVNTWVSYAIVRNVAFLDLHIFNRPDRNNYNLIHLPGALFTSGKLESLRLIGPILVKVPCGVCLPKLQVLYLRSVRYESDESVHKLISGCPVLNSLKIRRRRNGSDNVLVYKISSPSLRCLDIYDVEGSGTPPINGKLEIEAPALESLVLHVNAWKECSVTKLTSVNKVDMNLDYPLNDSDSDSDLEEDLYVDRCNSTVKLIQALNRAISLKLKGRIMESLSNATTPLSAYFERLTKLDIECFCCRWNCLNVMLGYSIKLQVLNITMIVEYEEDTHEGCWTDPEFVPECLLFSLTRISFTGFKGLEDEMAMIRYVLKHGAVMKLIHLQSIAYPGNVHSKLHMLQKISMFPRFSRTCQIQFD